MDRKRPRISVDLDGVINSYITPFEEPYILPDPPVPGAVEWLNEMTKHFDVVIHTTRAQDEGCIASIEAWLHLHGVDVEKLEGITNVKEASLIYIDDRGYRFEGDNFPTRDQIYRLKPWYKV